LPFFGFAFWWDWGLNSSVILLRSHLQSIFAHYF
jgi:hypothetical protein